MGPFYLRVSEPTRLTTGSTRMSRVLDEPGQKLTRIEICKKKFNPIRPEPVVSRVGSQVPTYFDSSNAYYLLSNYFKGNDTLTHFF